MPTFYSITVSRVLGCLTQFWPDVFQLGHAGMNVFTNVCNLQPGPLFQLARI